jgi:hypothetical protein
MKVLARVVGSAMLFALSALAWAGAVGQGNSSTVPVPFTLDWLKLVFGMKSHTAVYDQSWDCESLPFERKLSLEVDPARPKVHDRISLRLTFTTGDYGSIAVQDGGRDLMIKADRSSQIISLAFDTEEDRIVEGPFLDQRPYVKSLDGQVRPSGKPGHIRVDITDFAAFDVKPGEVLPLQVKMKPYRKCLGGHRPEEQDLIYSNIAVLTAPD